MYKDVLSSIEGIDIYPIISLLIFVVFFAGLIIWVARMDKNKLRELAALPLEGDELREYKEHSILSSGRTQP